MKKILITSILVFIILASILNTIYATNNYIDNALLNAAQNANNKYEEAVKKEDDLLKDYEDSLKDYYEDFSNSDSDNKSENVLSSTNNSNSTKLPQTGLSTNMYLLGIILCAVTVYTIFKLIKYRDI